MPVYERADGSTYYRNMTYEASTATDRVLRDGRRESSQLYEEIAQQQKACAKAGDYEGARALRELAQDAKRLWRAHCFVAPWYMTAPLPGDCGAVVPMPAWPVEIAAELDHVMGKVYLHG